MPQSPKRWVDCVDQAAGPTHLWDTGFQYGDWLDPGAPPDQPELARTETCLVATAYFARSAELLSQIAAILGDIQKQEQYRTLAEQVRAAFAAEFLAPNGRVVSDAETGYTLALQFGLLSKPEQRFHAGQRLAELVRRADFRINTGFLGTPLLCDALCDAGHEALAYSLLMQRECPSWLYAVTMGATTIWERWEALRPDGTPHPGKMHSFNHYAFGSVADWLHRTVAGLAPAEPGYRRLHLRPCPGGGLTWARASHRTPYGLAEIFWQLTNGQLVVEATVPPNTTALVELPGHATPFEVGAGIYRWSLPFSATITLDSPLSAFLDDARAWQTILQATASVHPGLGKITSERVRNSMRSLDQVSVRDIFGNRPMADRMLPALEVALAQELARIPPEPAAFQKEIREER